MRLFLAGVMVLCSLSAHAADVVMVCDEPCQRDMIAVLNAAKAQGLDLAAPVGRVWEKLKAAPVLKPDTPPAATTEKPQ